jgi:PAS domain S-box-containing protein
MNKNSKRRPQVNLILIVLLITFGFIGCKLCASESNTPDIIQLNLTTKEQLWLKQHTRIQIGVMNAWPPITFLQNGRIKGIDSLYIKALNKRLNNSLEIVPAPFKENYDLVASGKLDAIMDLTPKPSREPYFNFTRPYLSIPHIIIGPRSGVYFNSEDDLNGKTIALEKGFGNVRYFRENYPQVKIREYKNTGLCLDAVARGEVDAYAGNRAVATYIMEQELISNLKIHGRLNKSGSILAIGVRKDWPELATILDKAMESISDKERHQILANQSDTPEPLAIHPDLILTQEEKNWLQDHPLVRVHNEMTWAPINFNRYGKPKGFSIDVMDLLAQKIGLRIKYLSGPSWDEFITMTKKQELDIMLNIVDSTERRKYLNFTDSYLEFSQALYTRQDFPFIKSIDSLKGKIFAIPKGFYVEELLKIHPEVQILSVKDTTEAIQAVSNGQADVMLDVMPVVNYLSRQMLITNLKSGGSLGFDEGQVFKLSLGVRKDWNILRDILQKALATVSEGELQEIQDRWLLSPTDKKASDIRLSTDTQKKKTVSGLTVEESEFLKSHPVIRVHNEKDWPPFNYFEYGIPRGLSIDYMNLLAEKLNIKVEFISGSDWNEFLGMIKNKELDLMLNIVKTEKRQKYLLFTPTYMKNPNVIVSRKDKQFKSIEHLFGKTVAIPRGFYQEEILIQSFPQIRRLLFDDALESLKAVSFGKADAALGEKAVMEYIIDRNMLTGLKTSGEIDIGNPDLPNLRIGIRDDWPLLHSALVKAMADVSPLQIREIQKKWILSIPEEPEQASEKPGLVRESYMLPLALMVIAIVVIFMIISWQISRSKTRDISELYSSKEMKTAGLLIIALSLAVIILMASFRLNRFKEAIRLETENSLQTVLNTSHQMMMFWVKGKQKEAKIIAGDPVLSQHLLNLANIARKKDLLSNAWPQTQIRNYFLENQNRFGEIDYYILSPDMTVIGSKDEHVLGLPVKIDAHRENLLNRVFLGESVMVPPFKSNLFSAGWNHQHEKDEPTLLFAEPVKDQAGLIIAVFAIAFDPLRAFSNIAQSARLGTSGETYIFDNKGILLTESRFNNELQEIGLIKAGEYGTLNIKLLDPEKRLSSSDQSSPIPDDAAFTLMAKQAISERNGTNTEGYRDYRGITVVGSWLWDQALDMGMATEIDLDEAFAQYLTMRNTLVITLGITILIALALTGFSLWIGQSATRSLSSSKDQLEIRVEERTVELTKLEKRFRDLLESAPDSMIIINQDGIITIVNVQTEKLFGFNRDELIGQEIEMVIPQRFREGHPAKRSGFIKQALTEFSETKLELTALAKNKREFPVEVSLSPLKTDEGLLISAAVRDITERILAEEALRESEEKNRLVLDSVGEGIFGVNLQGIIMFINPAACSMLGYASHELQNQKIHQMIHHSHKDGSTYSVDECPMKMAYSSGETFTIDNEVLWKKDGTRIDVFYTATPIENNGKIEGAVITFRDMSEKIKAEEELKASEGRFRAYFEYGQVGMAVTHPDKGWLEINRRLQQILGYSMEELRQKTWVDLTHEEDVEEYLRYFQKMIDGEINNYSMDKRFIRKGGEIVHINLSVACVRDESGSVEKILASLLDITEAKKTEYELKVRFDELERFRRLAIGRELKMIGLKKEINEILTNEGNPEKYKIH